MSGAPILIIEDEPAVAAFIHTALERSGFATRIARSGVDALAMLEHHTPLFGVISDMRTPGGVTGADVHAWIKAHRAELLGRVIFITGDIVNEETRRLLGATGAPCIEKPFRVQQLLAAVREHLGPAETSVSPPAAASAADGPVILTAKDSRQ